MVESFASSEDMGMIALTLREGGDVWLAAASILAVEVAIGEDFTTVKTAVGETLGVNETPRVIFDTIEAIQRNAAHRAERRAVEEFIDFVTENEIDVTGRRDNPIELVESDERMKEIRRRGLAANDFLTKEEADKLHKEQEEAFKREQFFANMKSLGLSQDDAKALLGVSVPVTPAPDLHASDDEYRKVLREQGVDDATIETIIQRRNDEKFETEAEQEFGEDLGGAMERLRRREGGMTGGTD